MITPKSILRSLVLVLPAIVAAPQRAGMIRRRSPVQAACPRRCN